MEGGKPNNFPFSIFHSQLQNHKVVLLVEDNVKLNEINRRALELEGYTVLTALTLAEAREHLKHSAPDVILLDVLLPDGNGIDFCAELRNPNSQLSILNSQLPTVHLLFLTSRAEHEDRIRGLETGGDDYITKPYKLDEMLSRVRAAMRRRDMEAARSPMRTLTYGQLTLDIATRQAFLGGVDMLLKPKEFMILRLLVESKGAAIAKEVLYENVWRLPMASDGNALWTQVSRLKRKLEAHSSGIVTILVTRQEGYRLEISPQ